MTLAQHEKIIAILTPRQRQLFALVLELNIREINYFWWRLNLTYGDDPKKNFQAINNNNYLIETYDIYLKAIDYLNRIKDKEGIEAVENFISEFMFNKHYYLLPVEKCNWFSNNLRSALWLGQKIFNKNGDIFKAVGKEDYMSQLIKLIDMHALWLRSNPRITSQLKNIEQSPNYQHQENTINDLKYDWFTEHVPASEIEWLDRKNTKQLDDAIVYLAKKEKLVLHNHFIANTNEEKMAQILASLDYLAFFQIEAEVSESLQSQEIVKTFPPQENEQFFEKHEDEERDGISVEKKFLENNDIYGTSLQIRKKFIATFKKKYAMQTYRDNRKQSKEQNTIKLSSTSYVQLEAYSRGQGLSPKKAIEQLLQIVIDSSNSPKQEREKDKKEVEEEIAKVVDREVEIVEKEVKIEIEEITDIEEMTKLQEKFKKSENDETIVDDLAFNEDFVYEENNESLAEDSPNKATKSTLTDKNRGRKYAIFGSRNFKMKK